MMKKEPLLLYLVRLCFMGGIFFFLGMLYWSSLLIEEEMQGLTRSIATLNQSLSRAKTKAFVEVKEAKEVTETDSKYSNLLTKDPFYEKTLFTLLPKNFVPFGNFRQSTVGRAENLHPFSNWVDASAWQIACTVALADQHVGVYETMGPSLATRMEERIVPETGRPEFWIFLRQDLFWEPLKAEYFPSGTTLAPHFLEKHPVDAHDVKFFYDAMVNPFLQERGAVALRTYYNDVESVEVIDDYTLVVRWKVNDKNQIRYSASLLTGGLRPLASFVYKYFANGERILSDDSAIDAYQKSSLWAQNFSEHFAKNVIVSCGPWVFEEWNDRKIRFRRNENYFAPLENLLEEQVIAFRTNPDSPWQDFKNGETELVTLTPNQVREWEQFQESPTYLKQKAAGRGIKRLDYLPRSFSYIGWNETTPYFGSAKVRRAMTLAINRKRIIQDILDGNAVEISGPFFKEGVGYDTSIKPYPYDPLEAKKLLEEEGWIDRDGDGIRKKMVDGKQVPFRFTLLYYVKSPTTAAIADYISTSLKEIGVDCRLHGIDISDFSNYIDDKNFDALIMAWALGTPPEEPRQIWSSAGAKEKGSSNIIGYSNPEIDKIIDELEYERDKEKREALYHRFHAIMHEEAPYTFLFTPITVLLYRENLENVFIPAKRQDLIPGANVEKPVTSIFWMRK